MIKHSSCLVSAFLILSLVLSGCVSNTKARQTDPVIQPEQETVTLRFINSWGGSDSKSETLKQLFEQFETENPDIQIVNESLFGEDFLVKLKADFASGNDPDVFGLWPGSDIRSLVAAGKVADITDDLAKDPDWKESFHDNMWDHTTFGGRIYGLPVELIFEALFINVDLFEAYGLDPPANFDELKNVVTVFRDNGIVPIAFNCKSEGTYIYQNMAMMLGGRKIIENPIENSSINKCYLDALYLMKELYDLGAFPEDMFTMTSVERNDLFISKKAAMIVQGSWFVGEFKDVKTVDLVPFPELSENRNAYTSMIYGLGCGTFYMSKKASLNATKKEASIKLLRHLTSRETATLLAEKTGMLSNVRINRYDIDYNRLERKAIYYVDTAKELVGPPDSYLPRNAWENVIVKNLPYVLEGKMEPEALWMEAAMEWQSGK